MLSQEATRYVHAGGKIRTETSWKREKRPKYMMQRDAVWVKEKETDKESDREKREIEELAVIWWEKCFGRGRGLNAPPTLSLEGVAFQPLTESKQMPESSLTTWHDEIRLHIFKTFKKLFGSPLANKVQWNNFHGFTKQAEQNRELARCCWP